MSRSRLIAPATEQPVAIEELAAHLKLDSWTEEESDLTIKLSAATAIISEAMNRRQICEATWELRLTAWPCVIQLDIPQVSSVSSVKYTDNAGTLWTFDASKWKLVNPYDKTVPTQTTFGARIELNYGQFYWPTDVLDTGEPIAVRFAAGWKDAASVPYPIKAAILLEAGHLYRDRESVVTGRSDVSIPLARGVDSLIAPYVFWRF